MLLRFTTIAFAKRKVAMDFLKILRKERKTKNQRHKVDSIIIKLGTREVSALSVFGPLLLL